MERGLLLVALVAAGVNCWSRERAARVDRAIARGVTALRTVPVPAKPLKLRIPVVRKAADSNDNSNSSYAALGIRAGGCFWSPPRGTPAWLWNPVWRLGQAAGAIQTLKDECWKGIVSASYSK